MCKQLSFINGMEKSVAELDHEELQRKRNILLIQLRHGEEINCSECDIELDENNAYILDGKPVCIECYAKALGFEIQKCDLCDEPIVLDPAEEGLTYIYREVYQTPWQTNPDTVVLHINNKAPYGEYESCEEAHGDSGYKDFSYFYCEDCNRWICRQNPSNGWHTQSRIVGDCFEVCLACYEKSILENGVDPEDLRNGHIPGMFGPDAEEAGYKKDEGFIDYFVGDPKPFIDKALELIDGGAQIVVEYETMAIGYLEGYVTMWAKGGDFDEE
jgi:hypothetical protein